MDNNQLIGNIESVAAKLVDTLKRKNADYGNSFSVLYGKIGMPYAYGHLAEKLERIWSLMNKDAQVKAESLRDSLYDLAGYAILTLARQTEETQPEAKEQPSERCFSDKFPLVFKEGDFIRRVDEPNGVIWRVTEVSPTYILISSSSRDGSKASIVYPSEQGCWRKEGSLR